MLAENYSKEVRRWIEKVRLPSATCQACLSEKSAERDYILTCQLCQSSIHSKHYGRQIQDPKEQQLDKWYCERCRMICELAEQRKQTDIEAMQCHFCPSVKGIVKRVVFNAAETIWLHPECYTWPYPIVYQKNSRRIHFNSEYPTRATGKFWVNFQHQRDALCQICNDSRGLKIKCMYYTCEKYYHCSCAKTIGVIRDLQSMRFDNCETYIPPYCQEHLEKRITDCALKAKKYKALKDEVKASHFTQMAASYAVQHKNLLSSARKYQQQEKIRKQMEYQVGENEDIMEDLSFEEDASRVRSHHPPDFYEFVFDVEYPKRQQPTRRTSILQAHPTRMELEPSVPPPSNANQQQQPQINATINFLKTFSQNRAGKYERDSQPEESQWHSSPDFDEEDD